jgi:valyl-tRNA synthetase
VPPEAAELVALLTAGSVERGPAAGTTAEEALAAIAARAPREVLVERYRKEAEHLRSEIERGEKKLGNEAFVAKAAPHVVAKEREKLEGYREEFARVQDALREFKEPA